jgi:hypothetical protein
MPSPTVRPRHVLCILGHWSNFEEVERVVRQFPGFELDRDYSQLSPDARMTTAFEASYERVTPSMTSDDWQAVREHAAVAYVLSPPMEKAESQAISTQALLLTAELLNNGGLAAKGESAGVAHGRAAWLKLAAQCDQAARAGDQHALGSSLYFAWVRRPVLHESDGTFYSCGMHLLGERDLEIASHVDASEAVQWMDLLALYLVADGPQRPIHDGDGFRLTDDGPRRILRLGPCERYQDDEFFFNPYGYVRLESES